jgi:two-component system, LuxR family, response regulator FixJ
MADSSAVHVVDDDDAVRDSVVFLLETAGMSVTSYVSPSELLEMVARGGCGCVITDVRMPEMDGIELVRRIKAIDEDTPVVVITGHGDVPLAVEAMKAGAADFIEKPFDEETLLAAVQSALNRTSGDHAERQAIRGRLEQLSTREREVLQGLVEGQPNKVIAYHLGISPRTVEVYRAKAMTKMGADSFAELVRMVMLAGPPYAAQQNKS